MPSLNISLPEGLRRWIYEQVRTGRYGTASEYLRDLIRQDQKRQAEIQREELLVEGPEFLNPQEFEPPIRMLTPEQRADRFEDQHVARSVRRHIREAVEKRQKERAEQRAEEKAAARRARRRRMREDWAGPGARRRDE